MDALDDMKSLIDGCIGNPVFQEGRDVARAQCWACQGESVERTVDYLLDKLDELNDGEAATAEDAS